MAATSANASAGLGGVVSDGDGGGEREGDERRKQLEDGRRFENRFSYRDKLLSLGDSGFLETNLSTSEALTGWREYFAKMCENNPMEDANGDREEGPRREQRETWRTIGKLPSLSVTSAEYEAWCKPYMNSLIVKLLGKSFSEGFMRQRMERMWNPKSPMKVTPLSNGYFIISFSTPEDRDYALQEGLWIIGDHYLLVQRWRPNFNPWKADTQTN